MLYPYVIFLKTFLSIFVVKLNPCCTNKAKNSKEVIKKGQHDWTGTQNAGRNNFIVSAAWTTVTKMLSALRSISVWKMLKM